MNLPENVNIGFKKNVIDGVVFYTVPAFEPYVNYAFCGDKANNLSFKAIRGVSDEQMRQSFLKLCNVLNLSYERCTMTNIVHGTELIEVNESNMGKGVCRDEKLPPCDGLVTTKAGIPIASTHADCMPIALYDKTNKIGCVIHAGWRGVLADIQGKAVRYMQNNFWTSVNKLLVAIGPTINSCCFEVGKDVGDDFISAFGNEFVISGGINGNKNRIDLVGIVVNELLELGVIAENITVDGQCTACDKSGLVSFRRDRENAGTMVQIMCLR